MHDSRAAIPLERMTGQRIRHLYSLMDSAYDAKPIRDFITDNGRIPIEVSRACSIHSYHFLVDSRVGDI
ncbi:MAG TPA: hypothetical protein PLW57_01730 [Sphaerochaeta sp.]|nr:hypothetical protein [Sphaerochaeta sp.]HPK63558.1 hypothetical protein [Sphaerochaeta sp.]